MPGRRSPPRPGRWGSAHPIRLAVTITAALLIGGAVAPTASAAAPVPDFTTSEAGNPIFDGYYADPDAAIYDGKYWVFPTTSKTYGEQTYLDAFSSTDLVNWTKHERVLTTEDVSWAEFAVWAPSPIERDGKYYLYFAANDIQNDSQLGGIGVAVADRPEGPYRDAIGRPLIDAFHNGAQPIDQDVFIDDDGQAYMYYGGHRHANVVKLNPDMTSLGTFDDGTTFREITPSPAYVEGSQMFKRNGTYYLMWSEGGWTGPNYSVSYAMADSPLGPFSTPAKVLAQDPAVARGSGHNGVINLPGTDIWYIVYHRRPLSQTDGNARQVAYDRLQFNADGTIAPVTMLVQDNFADRNTLGWRTWGGEWSAKGRDLRATRSTGGKALLDTHFTDLTQDVDVMLTGARGDAGVVFRATRIGEGPDNYAGYYAGIGAAGQVSLGRADGRWAPLASADMRVAVGRHHHLRVTAVGPEISVFVDDMTTPKIRVTDATFTSGANGVRVFEVPARFDDFSVRPAGR